jgi:hypothetical protein
MGCGSRAKPKRRGPCPPGGCLTGDAAELLQVLRRTAATPLCRKLARRALMAQVQRRCQGYGEEGEAIAQRHQALFEFLDHSGRSLARISRGRGHGRYRRRGRNGDRATWRCRPRVWKREPERVREAREPGGWGGLKALEVV